MKKPQKTTETESDWKKIGPCLYRYRRGKYYALLKQGGKQIRRFLETDDLPPARRKLTELCKDLETTDSTLAARNLQKHAERFLTTINGADSTIYISKLNIGKVRLPRKEEWAQRPFLPYS